MLEKYVVPVLGLYISICKQFFGICKNFKFLELVIHNCFFCWHIYLGFSKECQCKVQNLNFLPSFVSKDKFYILFEN